jgi:hypothetical protein
MLKINSLNLSATGLVFHRWMGVFVFSLIFLFCLQAAYIVTAVAEDGGDDYYDDGTYYGDEGDSYDGGYYDDNDWGDYDEDGYYYEDLTWDDPLAEDLIGDSMEDDPLAVDLISGDVYDYGDAIDMNAPADDAGDFTDYDSGYLGDDGVFDYGESGDIGEQENLIDLG